MKLAISELEASDRQYCWEVVRRVQPLFFISAPYLPEPKANGVLALFALFAAIEEVFFKVTDGSVAKTKLTWWAEQVLTPHGRASEHPIVRSLHRSGIFSASCGESLEPLMQTSLSRLDAPAPTHAADLKSLCVDIGLYPLQLELAYLGHESKNPPPEGICAINGLLQLLRESSRRQNPTYCWLPMNLLARHGTTHTLLATNDASAVAFDLIKEICRLGESWWTDVRLADRHCHVLASLNNRLLQLLKTIRLQDHAGAFARTGLADSWHAWKSARRWAPP